jgi:signal transduction histidine kinase
MGLPSFQAAQDEWPSKMLHAVLLAGFTGLLGLLLAAGLAALHFLRDLRAAEADLAHSLSARTESLTSLIRAVHLYNSHIQQDLLEDKDNGQDFRQLAREIDLRLKSYPAPRSPEEEQMLGLIGQQSREQEQLVVRIFTWTREDRRRKALDYLRNQIIPKELAILQTREKVALWNQQQLESTARRQLEFSDRARARLTLALLLALLAGVLLAAGSLAWVLRLARQARRSYRELARSRGELQQLSARLLDAQEEERRAISRELHDQVGQSLGTLLVDAGQLATLVPPQIPGAQERLGRIRQVAENTLQEVRDIALLLRPSMLDDLGLVAALDWQAREVERRSDAQVYFDAQGVSENLPDEYKTTIYRLVQEALHNAVRHAAAKHIRLVLHQAQQKITVTVSDDGRGFDPSRNRGMGLLGMEERVKRLGGAFAIESNPGAGTTLRFELPVSVH